MSNSQLPPGRRLTDRGGPIPAGMRDDGPPHRGRACLGPTGDWLCRISADLPHHDCIPYVEGEYLAPVEQRRPA
ncbi:hypothetical protein B0675_40075 [Streptomyces sp. M41(2017)]|uniref:hypothetical protein n=1 Tax=Streptomyces sp. M41(2017) TaxID=1955065 RepID=UPI0009BFBA56|nr:hypothetical protein [Streptomyces sp. M41(2017)]OQQ13018.1 hypothetical protein B0675_40075 [Streptomyces sp. M41(2017)]